MSIRTKQELEFAKRIVEHRKVVFDRVGSEPTKKHALMTHRELCGGLREVTKHRANILSELDNEGAGHALEANELYAVALEWVQRSREALTAWGVSELEVGVLEDGLGVRV